MDIKTEKVRPLDREDIAGTVSSLCTQFALLIDEVTYGFRMLEKEQKELKRRMSELEQKSSS